MTNKQIDNLATEMAKHLPCTTASIADALRKAFAVPPDAQLADLRATAAAGAEAITALQAQQADLSKRISAAEAEEAKKKPE